MKKLIVVLGLFLAKADLALAELNLKQIAGTWQGGDKTVEISKATVTVDKEVFTLGPEHVVTAYLVASKGYMSDESWDVCRVHTQTAVLKGDQIIMVNAGRSRAVDGFLPSAWCILSYDLAGLSEPFWFQQFVLTASADTKTLNLKILHVEDSLARMELSSNNLLDPGLATRLRSSSYYLEVKTLTRQ